MRARPPSRALARRARGALAAFGAARSGAVALLFGLALVPLGAAVAVGVEYGRALSLRTKLQAAADAAVLAGLAAPRGQEAETARRLFAAQSAVAGAGRARLGVEVESDDGARTVRATFRAPIQLPFGALIGRASVDVAGVAQAGVAAPPYVDLHVLADFSGSMSMAADEAGRDRLRALTRGMLTDDGLRESPRGCAFACHEWNGYQRAGTPDFASVARANGVDTRADVVRRSVNRLIDLMASFEGAPRRFRMGFYGFDAVLKSVQPVTDRWPALRAAVADARATYHTDPSRALDHVLGAAGASGRGATPLDARKMFLLITDGVMNVENGAPAALDPAACEPFKARGITVHVIHTVYVDFPGDLNWEANVRPIKARVIAALRACASPGHYHETSAPAEIEAAFRAVFAALTRPLALTR